MADWPAIFLINLAVGLVLAAALRATGGRAADAGAAGARGRPDWIGLAAARWSPSVFGAIVFIQPSRAWSAT